MNKMKKLLALMLALLMVFSLVACGGGDDADAGDSDKLEIVWWAFPTAELASVTISTLLFIRIWKKEIKPLYSVK